MINLGYFGQVVSGGVGKYIRNAWPAQQFAKSQINYFCKAFFFHF